MPDQADIVGRPFTITPIYATPTVGNTPGTSVGSLMPDSTTPIHGLSDDGWWYAVPKGYVPRETLQPIEAYTLPGLLAEPEHGFYEVVAPMAVVRDCCAYHGRVVARLAFGSLAYVHDHLTDDHGQLWYAVSGTPSGAGPFGWTPASNLRRWLYNPKTRLAEPSIWIDSHTHKLTVYDRDQFVGETALYSGLLLPGMGRLAANTPSTWYDMAPYAYPWNMLLHRDYGKPVHFRGATWHNRFGLPGEQRNFADMPVLAARWIFNMLAGAPRTGVPVAIE